jgi:transcriptional regulator with XRE-family HTH domain
MVKALTNVALKVAIVATGKKQLDIARAARIPETRLSHIVRNRITPTANERKRLAAVLQRSEAELFGSVAA